MGQSVRDFKCRDELCVITALGPGQVLTSPLKLCWFGKDVLSCLCVDDILINLFNFFTCSFMRLSHVPEYHTGHVQSLTIVR